MLLEVISQYKVFIGLGILFCLVIPFYLFVDRVRKQDRAFAARKNKKVQVEKSKSIIEELSDEEMTSIEQEITENSELHKFDSIRQMSDQELSQAYKRIRASLPNVDFLIQMKKIPKEEGKRVRDQLDVMITILSERQISKGQDQT
ncbi:hypothetical protein P9G84_31210 [Brevibacillus centrosporus]|uniref:hypothetical protein n=1 Tax=Brevibacillus centrosporus TaxID=54910 RepID=UPI001143AFA0|nr:hypothetical protein [Brevibacillus centrosporus]MEC2133327.1 hypothetical protein [Brevibacillus centrosporus]GED33916.1 hypothetical protein BCE02nite_50570 [Brevibacillus centrosporus]